MSAPAPTRSTSRHGAFRGLVPYDLGDAGMFFGRGREVDTLFALLREPQTRTLILYGAPGVGKTSLLRAGLGPKLAQASAPCILLTPSHFAARPVPEALWREVNIAPPKDDEPPGTTLNRVAMAARGVVVVIDDLDQLGSGLLPPRTSEHLGTFASLVQRGDGRVRVILCVEDEDFWRLSMLEGTAPGLLSGAARMPLSPMDEAAAAEAMERTVISGGNYLEAGLSAMIAHELAERGLIPPVIVQMIGAAAVSRRVTNQASYRREGGSRMLLDRFLLDPLGQVGPDATSVFGVLAESSPSPVGRDEMPTRTQLVTDRISVALNKLVEVGLVRRVSASTGEFWTLTHRWLARRGREATAQLRIERRQTAALVRQKLEARQRLGLGELKAARRVYQSAAPGLETTLVKHSTRFYVTLFVVAAAALVAAIGGLAVTGSRSFHVALAGGHGVPPGETQVVIDRGRPSLGPLRTGFERSQRMVNTGFTTRVLQDEGKTRLLNRAPGQGQPAEQTGWLTDVIASLRPFSQGLAALALGDASGIRAIGELYAAGQYREHTLIALGFFGKGKGPEEQKLIAGALADPSPVRRRRATRAILRLSKRVPGSQLGQLLSLQEKGDLGLRSELLEAAATELSPVDAEPLLSGALRDPSPELRARAVSIVEARAEKEPQLAARLAVQVLGEANEKLRERISRLVVETVRRAPATAGVELQRVAVDPKAPEEVRVGAAEALIGLDDKDAKPILGALAEKLAQDGSARLKALGLTLVGRLGPPETAIEPLRAAAKEAGAKEPATLIRAGAAAGLYYLGPSLTDGGFSTLRSLTYDSAPKVREAAARALGGWRKDKDTIKVLKNLLYDPQAAVNRAAAEALGQVASFNPYGSVDALKVAYGSNRTDVRVAAMKALDQVARHYPSASLPGLVKGLKDSSPQVSAQAALSLGRVAEKDPESAVKFLPIAARDEDPAVRAAAAQAYGSVLAKKPALAQKPLLGFVGDKDARVRRAAAQALLPELKKGESLAVLPKLLGDEDREIRKLARELLEQQHEKLDAKVVEEGLLTLLGHSEGAERVVIIRLAIKLGRGTVAERAAADPVADVRLAAAEAGVPVAVEAAAGDPDPALRRAAVLGTARLAETEPARALPIVSALAYDDDDRVARGAARALAQLAQKASGKYGEQARATLEQLVRSASERRRAAGALALGDAEGALQAPAQKLLEPLLIDGGGDVRLEAILAYGRLAARAARAAGKPAQALDGIDACTAPSRRLAGLVAAIEAAPATDRAASASVKAELEKLSARPCGRLEALLARAALESGGTAREALFLAAAMFGWH